MIQEKLMIPSVRLDKGIPGLAGKLQGIPAGNNSVLESCDPLAKPRSLPELMEDSR